MTDYDIDDYNSNPNDYKIQYVRKQSDHWRNLRNLAAAVTSILDKPVQADKLANIMTALGVELKDARIAVVNLPCNYDEERMVQPNTAYGIPKEILESTDKATLRKLRQRLRKAVQDLEIAQTEAKRIEDTAKVKVANVLKEVGVNFKLEVPKEHWQP